MKNRMTLKEVYIRRLPRNPPNHLIRKHLRNLCSIQNHQNQIESDLLCSMTFQSLEKASQTKNSSQSSNYAML